jgi:teichuronic acid biosynthesis glycosyltransferase TuaG
MSIHSPAISIVMPAYNAAPYITATMQSVFAQTFTDWELLVINDCSTDSTADMIRAYQEKDPRIHLINLEKNKGAPAGPRNIGVNQARGQWIAFLDSDDIWHPQKLQRQIQLLRKTQALFCSTQMTNFNSSKLPVLEDATTDQFEHISFIKQLIKFRTPTSSVIADRALLLKYPFNEDMAYKAREDLDCWLHCHEEIQRSVKVTSPMMGYRIIDGQISGKKWVMFKRHFHVLRNYRLLSGRTFSAPEALLFTLTHFILAIYYRTFKKGL